MTCIATAQTVTAAGSEAVMVTGGGTLGSFLPRETRSVGCRTGSGMVRRSDNFAAGSFTPPVHLLTPPPLT